MNALAIAPDRIVQLGYAFTGAKTFLSAVELGVFSALADGPLDLVTLRERLGIHQRGASDFLDALVALGMLERGDDGSYANAPDADVYLDSRKPTYIGGEYEHLNARTYAHWKDLTAALRTGEPQTGAGAAGNFPAMYADPDALDLFLKAMSGATWHPATELAAKFPWQNYRSVVDIGTAQGCLPVRIGTHHAHLTGGGFDLPPVQPHFETYVAKHGLTGRLRFFPGDFFRDPLPPADVLVLGRVLHDWDLATKKMLLAKAHDALPGGGAIVVYERLIDDERCTSAAGLLSSLNMLVMTAGGFDFTARDCIEWMEEAGFYDMRVEPLTSDQAMVVGTK